MTLTRTDSRIEDIYAWPHFVHNFLAAGTVDIVVAAAAAAAAAADTDVAAGVVAAVAADAAADVAAAGNID